MPYDRFEEEWNGVPAPMVDRSDSSKTLFNQKNSAGPSSAPKNNRYIPKKYQPRPPSEKKPTYISSVCCEWKSQAAKLPKCAILAGDVVWHKAGLEKDTFVKERRAESRPLKLNSHLRKRLNVSSTQMSRGIKSLEEAGLLRRLEKTRGKLQVVVLINVWLIRQKEEHENDMLCEQIPRPSSDVTRGPDRGTFPLNRTNNEGDN